MQIQREDISRQIQSREKISGTLETNPLVETNTVELLLEGDGKKYIYIYTHK